MGRQLFRARGALNSLLYLLESPDLDLADTLARNAELGREVFEGYRVIDEAASLEDAALTVVERRQRVGQIILATAHLLRLDQALFLLRRVVDEPILPFAGF